MTRLTATSAFISSSVGVRARPMDRSGHAGPGFQGGELCTGGGRRQAPHPPRRRAAFRTRMWYPRGEISSVHPVRPARRRPDPETLPRGVRPLLQRAHRAGRAVRLARPRRRARRFLAEARTILAAGIAGDAAQIGIPRTGCQALRSGCQARWGCHFSATLLAFSIRPGSAFRRKKARGDQGRARNAPETWAFVSCRMRWAK